MTRWSGFKSLQPHLKFNELSQNKKVKGSKKQAEIEPIQAKILGLKKHELDKLRTFITKVLKEKYPRKRNYEVPSEERTPTKEEVKIFFKNVNNPFYETLFKLMYFTGLRITEARTLKAEHVNFSEGSLLVKVEKKRYETFVRSYFPKSFANELRAYTKFFNTRISKHGFLFPNSEGLPISSQNCGDAFRHALKKAGLNDSYTKSVDGRSLRFFSTHSLRKAFVTSVEEVSSLNVASKAVHHANIAVTQRHYSSVTRERRREAVEKAFEDF